MPVKKATRVVVLVLLGAVLLFLSVSCAEAKVIEGLSAIETRPGLKPAPTRQSAAQPSSPSTITLVTITPDAVYPPTATATTDSSVSPLSAASTEQAPTLPGGADARATPDHVQANDNREDEARFAVVALKDGINCPSEIEAYEEHLSSNPALATYAAPVVAACYLEQNDRRAAIEVYQAAVAHGAERTTEVALRQGLAGLLVEEGDYSAALAQYEAILALAETEATRSQALFMAGQTELMAGNRESGYALYLRLINDYPDAVSSYRALTELLTAGYIIDDYLQGRVAYEARVYDVAAAAFRRAIESGSEQWLASQLHLAWSLEKLGDVEQALMQLDEAIEVSEQGSTDISGGGILSVNPASGAQIRIERAKLQTGTGRFEQALQGYQEFLTLYPRDEQAPLAAWQSAALAESLGYLSLAQERYQAFAESFTGHDDAAEALFRSGYISWRLNELDEALSTWQRTVDVYPGKEYGAAAMLWLLKQSPDEEIGRLADSAADLTSQGYYSQRVRHLLSGVEPFDSAGVPDLAVGDIGRDYAEGWLREWLNLDEQESVASLSEQLASDARLIRGETLWHAGQRTEAAHLLESLRADHAADALASYQLALYFRDLGLYRSSLLAASTVMNLAGVGAYNAPRFIARLAYPANFAQLVTAEAQTYGYDPLLQLALMREESFFDPLATSAAGAQGMSQLLPETGAHIAGQLGWPDYQDGDLYRPEVAIAAGAFFLGQQLDRYDRNVTAALASYNAGPGFADRWYKLGSDDHDSFLEAVDFPETQRYIRQVYAVHAIYRFLYS